MEINLDAIKNEYHSILQLINDQNADSWKGFENGDDIPKFQGRKLRQAALTMLLVSEELENGIFMTDDERRNLFYSHVRLWCDEMNGSLTTRLSLPSIPNIWKCLDKEREAIKQTNYSQ